MPTQLAAKAKLSYGLLVLPLDALTSSARSSAMLSVDFDRDVGPAACVALLHAICVKNAAFATIANFRGRVLFPARPDQHVINAITMTKAIRFVRPPFVERSNAAPAGEDDDTAATTHLPVTVAHGPALLVESDGFLPPKWVEKIVEHIKTTMPNQNPAITTMDGRTAIISCSPSVVAAFAGKFVGPRIRLHDYTVVSAAAAAARKALEESLARPTQQQ
jgi:hypothetical protein